eukprot:gene46727-58260_t
MPPSLSPTAPPSIAPSMPTPSPSLPPTTSPSSLSFTSPLMQIQTVMGTGMDASTGDYGPGVAAGIVSPYSIWADSDGKAYIAENNNDSVSNIRTLSNSIAGSLFYGTFTTVAGTGFVGFTTTSGPATSTPLTFPAGVWGDSLGNIYSSENAGAVKIITTSGFITTLAGTGVS